jgi:hypothetical protein
MADLPLGAARSLGNLLKTRMFTIWAVKVKYAHYSSVHLTKVTSRGRYIQVLFQSSHLGSIFPQPSECLLASLSSLPSHIRSILFRPKVPR